MAGNNCEDDLELQFVKWKSSRNADYLMDSRPRRGLNHLRMSGLEWVIEVLPLPNTKDYIFNIINVKRSKSPLHLSKATPANLLAKFNLLVVALQRYIRSVFRVEELLDKLYACSLLLCWAENDKRWWVIIDAEIMAVACKTAREETQEAAKAAVALVAEGFPRQNITTGELCATRFSATERWDGIAGAVDGGAVLQWCKLQFLELERTIPCFEFEVAVPDFLEGNDEISRIGVVNSHVVEVTVYLEDDIQVVCSQEGIETETSLVLSLLQYLIGDYITIALQRNEGEHGIDNIVQCVLQHVVWYICEARKDICMDNLPLTWTSDGPWGREWYARNSSSNQQGLSTLLLTDDVDDYGNESAEDDDDDDGNESGEDIC